MPRQINKLSARSVKTITKIGRHADGAGLYLIVDGGGAKRWVFLYRDRRTQKLREMGLGGLATVTLANAREKAAEARAHLAARRDPIVVRRSSQTEIETEQTFGAIADALIASMEPSWKNPKHRAQWRMTLRVYCRPLRHLPVDQITTEDVLGVLQPIWLTVPETASRVRGRIERVIDAARARGLRKTENPARWRGHLANLLPPRARLKRGHHAAMPFDQVPSFISDLRGRAGIAPLALEFLVLTATRTGEVIGAIWPEIDLEKELWTIPAERMKAKRGHVVPLSARCVEILREARKLGVRSYVFPGQDMQAPLSSMAFAAVLRRMDVTNATPHGFRSSFRDWCGELTSFPREVAEAALAHSIPDRTEAAYRRGSAIEKRRQMMEEWAAFCVPKGTNVVQLRQTAGV
jgi:integrase